MGNKIEISLEPIRNFIDEYVIEERRYEAALVVEEMFRKLSGILGSTVKADDLFFMKEYKDAVKAADDKFDAAVGDTKGLKKVVGQKKQLGLSETDLKFLKQCDEHVRRDGKMSEYAGKNNTLLELKNGKVEALCGSEAR